MKVSQSQLELLDEMIDSAKLEESQYGESQAKKIELLESAKVLLALELVPLHEELRRAAEKNYDLVATIDGTRSVQTNSCLNRLHYITVYTLPGDIVDTFTHPVKIIDIRVYHEQKTIVVVGTYHLDEIDDEEEEEFPFW